MPSPCFSHCAFHCQHPRVACCVRERRRRDPDPVMPFAVVRVQRATALLADRWNRLVHPPPFGPAATGEQCDEADGVTAHGQRRHGPAATSDALQAATSSRSRTTMRWEHDNRYLPLHVSLQDGRIILIPNARDFCSAERQFSTYRSKSIGMRFDSGALSSGSANLWLLMAYRPSSWKKSIDEISTATYCPPRHSRPCKT